MATKYLLSDEYDTEADGLVDPDPEVPEMGLGEEDGILMPKSSKELGFDESADAEDGFKNEKEEEGEEEEI